MKRTNRNTREFLLKAACILSAGVVGMSALQAYAQATSGDVIGTATDSSGAVVANAPVVLHSLSTGEVRRVNTNSRGEYVFSQLQVGHYSITIQEPGYKSFVVEDVALSVGDRLRVDVHLQTGEVNETVTVQAVNSALQTDSSTVGDLFTSKSVQDLPLNGRNYIGLVQVSAGVTTGQPGSVQSGNRNDDRRQTTSYSANGQSEILNNNQIDGLDNNERIAGYVIVRPSVEGIDQISIETSSYPADVGRAAGAVVNVITKAGTERLHGSLFEYFRNDALDARDYFASSGRKPELRQNQFGGSLGGPLFGKKTFFFGDVEFLRNVNASTALYTVPTAYEQANPGDFTDLPAGSSGYLPSAYLNSVGLAYFKLYPTPNRSGISNNYQGTTRTTQNATTVDARIDHRFGEKDSLFGRFAYNPVTTFTGGGLPAVNGIQPGGTFIGVSGNSSTKTYNCQLSDTHVFTPNVIFQVNAGFSRYHTVSTALNDGTNASSKLGLQGVNLPTVAGTSGLSFFQPTGYAPLGDTTFLPEDNTSNIYQLNGNMTFVRGQHTIKAGAAIIRRESSLYQQNFGVGYYIFIPLQPYFANSLLEMLSGTALAVLRQNQLTSQIVRFWEPSVYLKDDWRATSNLTLNLGVRYEVYPAGTEKRNRLTNFNLSTLSLVQASDANRTAGVQTGYTNFSPRVGFALSLPHKSVFRGGFGISFYPADVQGAIQLPNLPYAFSATQIFQSLSKPLVTPTADNPATFASNPNVTNLNAKDSNFRTAYIEEFNLFAQRAFGSYVVSIGYVGELGRRQLYLSNQATPAPPGANQPTPAYRFQAQLPYVTTITLYNNAASSSYNAVQVQLQRQVARGLTLNANYTYARGLGNTFSGSGANGTGPQQGLIYNNPAYDYGNSDLDVRNRFAASVAYELPFGRSLTGAKALAFKGWQANSIAYWQSGLPFTVVSNAALPNGNASINLPNTRQDRPNMLRSAKLAHPTLTRFFDTSAFQEQTPGTAGNEERNQIYGPHDRRFDVSLFKQFPIYREATLSFRTECFNCLNIANFGTPNTVIPAADANGYPVVSQGFGSISNTAQNEIPRQLQFALKLTF